MIVSSADGWTPAVLGGLAAFGDAILGVGVVLPGEVIVAGLASTAAGSQLVRFIALVTLGAVLGDHLNYGLGRVLGQRLARSRVVAKLGVQHWDRGVRLVARHGAPALVVTRLVPVVRTMVPAIAGGARMPYRRFLAASAVGSLAWSLIWTTAGGAVLTIVGTASPRAGWIVLALAAVTLASVFVWRSRRDDAARPERTAHPTPTSASDPQPACRPHPDHSCVPATGLDLRDVDDPAVHADADPADAEPGLAPTGGRAGRAAS